MTKGTRHGSTAGYSSGCRCDDCKRAKAEYRKQYAATRKEVTAAYNKSYAAANAESIRLRKRAYYAENREAIAARTAEWKKNNPEKMQASRRRYREKLRDRRPPKIKPSRPTRTPRLKLSEEEKRERTQANRLRYRTSNPESVRNARRRYRARVRSADHGCVDVDGIQNILKLCEFKCVYCGGDYEHMDHVMPISKGGLHCVQNLVPSCRRCNQVKAAQVPERPHEAILLCPLLQTAG